MTPFIDKVGEFPDGTVYRFEWEREWRVPRRLDLGVVHPAFLFAPAAEHTQLVADLTVRGVAGTPQGSRLCSTPRGPSPRCRPL